MEDLSLTTSSWWLYTFKRINMKKYIYTILLYVFVLETSSAQVPDNVYKYYEHEDAPLYINIIGGNNVSLKRSGYYWRMIKNPNVICMSSFKGQTYSVISSTYKEYKTILPFSEGLAAVAKTKYSSLENIYCKWGFIDERKNTIIPCKYWRARSFHEGLAAVYKSTKTNYRQSLRNPKGWYGWIYINTKGEEIISETFKAASDFSDGMAIVVKETDTNNPEYGPMKVCSINKKGEVLDTKIINNKGYNYFIPSPFAEWTNKGDSILCVDSNGKVQLVKNTEPKHSKYNSPFHALEKISGKEIQIKDPACFGEIGIHNNVSTEWVHLKGFNYLCNINVYGDKTKLISSANNNGDLLLCLASKYYLGDQRFLINQSYKKAFGYFKECATKYNDIDAQFMLGWMYEHGQGIEKDERMSSYWYDKSKRKRVALIIGNWDYVKYLKKSLRSPRKDIEDMYKSLIQIGFEKPMVARNANKKELEDSIRVFLKKANTADVAVVYYSGHGLQYNKKNYLLPNDYEQFEYDSKNEKDISRKLDERCIIGQEIMSKMDSLECERKFLILDACRDHSFGGRKGDDTEKFVKMESNHKKGTCVLFATTEGSAAYDGGNGENSFFTQALLEGLKKPSLTFRKLFDYVQEKVKHESSKYKNEIQIPVVFGIRPVEDFIFNDKQ